MPAPRDSSSSTMPKTNIPSDAAVKELKMRLGSLQDTPSFVSPMPKKADANDQQIAKAPSTVLRSIKADMFESSVPSPMHIESPVGYSAYPAGVQEVDDSDVRSTLKILNSKLKISQLMYDKVVSENLQILRAKEKVEQELDDTRHRLVHREGLERSELDNSRHQLDSYEQQFKPLCQELITVRKDLAKTLETNEELEADIRTLKRDLENSTAEFEHAIRKKDIELEDLREKARIERDDHKFRSETQHEDLQKSSRKKLEDLKKKSNLDLEMTRKKAATELSAALHDAEDRMDKAVRKVEERMEKELREKDEKTERELKRMREEHENDRNAFEEKLQQKDEQMERELQRVEAELREARDLKKHSEEMKAIERRNAELEELYKQIEGRNRELVQEAADAKEREQEASIKLESVQKALGRVKEQYEGRKKEDIEGSIQVIKEQHQKEKADIEKELEASIQAIKEQHQKDSKAFECETSELRGRLADTELTLGETKDQVQKCTTTITELQSVKKQLAQDVANLESRASELKAQVEASQSAAEQAEKKRAEIQKLNDRLMLEIPEQFQSKLEVLKAQAIEAHIAAEKREQKLQKRLAKRDTEVEHLRGVWRSLLVSHPDLDKVPEVAAEEIRNLSKDRQRLEQEVEDARSENEGLVVMVAIQFLRLMLANWRRPQYKETLRQRVKEARELEDAEERGEVDHSLFHPPFGKAGSQNLTSYEYRALYPDGQQAAEAQSLHTAFSPSNRPASTPYDEHAADYDDRHRRAADEHAQHGCSESDHQVNRDVARWATRGGSEMQSVSAFSMEGHESHDDDANSQRSGDVRRNRALQEGRAKYKEQQQRDKVELKKLVFPPRESPGIALSPRQNTISPRVAKGRRSYEDGSPRVGSPRVAIDWEVIQEKLKSTPPAPQQATPYFSPTHLPPPPLQHPVEATRGYVMPPPAAVTSPIAAQGQPGPSGHKLAKPPLASSHPGIPGYTYEGTSTPIQKDLFGERIRMGPTYPSIAAPSSRGTETLPGSLAFKAPLSGPSSGGKSVQDYKAIAAKADAEIAAIQAKASRRLSATRKEDLSPFAKSRDNAGPLATRNVEENLARGYTATGDKRYNITASSPASAILGGSPVLPGGK